MTHGRPKGPNPTLHEHLIEELRTGVLSGVLEPGTRLRQVELAATYGVSFGPIREALRALEQEGLVKSIPRRGWVVNQLLPREVLEIYELREILEQMALREAVPKLTAEHIVQLRDLTATIVASAEAQENLQARERFYEVLYGVSEKPRLVSLIMSLHSQLTPYLRRRRARHSADAHLRLMEALERRDVASAAAIVSAHLTELCRECVEEAIRADGDADPRAGHISP